MADVSRIRQRMAVIAADGRRVGFVDRSDVIDKIRVTSLSTSHGHHRRIPVAWVEAVDKYVHLNKGSRFIEANWEPAE